MADLIKYDNLILTDEVYDFLPSNPNRVPIAGVSKRHGAVVTDVPTAAERQVQLKGVIYGREYDVTDPSAGAIARLDTIAAALSEFNKPLYYTSSRFINAYPTGFNWAFRHGSAGKVIDFAINFICPDPFWYTTTDVEDQTVELLNSDSAESGFPGSKIKNAVINNSGTAYTFVKVTVTNANALSSLSRCRVVNQTIPVDAGIPYRDWVYSNSVLPGAGSELVVDSSAMTVVNRGFIDAEGFLKDLEHWVGTWLWLEPGNNTIQVAGTPEADYLFEWRPRNW